MSAAQMIPSLLLADRLSDVFCDPRYRPPPAPTVAMQLLELSKDDEVDVGDVAAIFNQDPLLATHVIRIASSPLYGSVTVPTVRAAVIRLGNRRIRRVVFEAAVDLRLFRNATYRPWMERIRRHCVAVGHIAAHLAELTGVDAEEAFIAGLVHDVGIAAALAAMSEHPEHFADIDPAGLGAGVAAVHLNAGMLIAKAWGLKGNTRLVISGHHDVTITHHPLLATIVIAEALALGAGFDATCDGLVLDPLVSSDLDQASRILRIDAARIVSLSLEMRPLFELIAAS